MRTSIDISQVIYKALNKSVLTEEISGQLVIERRPESSDLEDVVIVPLTNQVDFIQQGYVNVNAFCKDLSNNTPNAERLNTIAHIIDDLIKAYIPEAGEAYFTMSVDSQLTLPDDRGNSYVNMRIKFVIEQ